MFLLIGTVSQVSNVAHGPHVTYYVSPSRVDIVFVTFLLLHTNFVESATSTPFEVSTWNLEHRYKINGTKKFILTLLYFLKVKLQ